MHVSLDHEKLVFLHKHPDYRVLANLDFIANRSHHTSTGPIDCNFFDHVQLPELQKLFRNTTGRDAPTNDHHTLVELLLALASYLPVTECDPAEVERQASWFEDKFTEGVAGFGYARGSNVPVKRDLTPLSTAQDPSELLQGARGSAARKQALRQRLYNREGLQGVPAPTPQPAGERSAANAAKPASRPRSGVCGLIHDALDAQLKSGTVPTREWIKQLASERGWNTSTAGVQYGAWRKQNNLP